MPEADCAKALRGDRMNKKVIEANRHETEAFQPRNEDNQNDDSQYQYETIRDQCEDTKNKNDDAKPSYSNRISRFIRSVWRRLFCCRTPPRSDLPSETRSEDEAALDVCSLYLPPDYTNCSPDKKQCPSIYFEDQNPLEGSKHYAHTI